MPEKPSIWQKEIKLPWGDLRDRIPAGAAEWAAVVCAGLFILSPFVFGVLCLIHRSVDYTIIQHPRFITGWVWPLSALAGLAAIGLTLLRGRIRGKQLLQWLRKNPVCLCFAFLVAWMLLSSCVNGWNDVYQFGDSHNLYFETLFMQFGYFLILFPAALLIRDRRKKRWLARLHVAVSLFLALAAFVLWQTQISSVIFQWRKQVTAIYSNINYYGYYLSVAIPLAAAMFVAEDRPGWKALSAVSMAVNTVALSLNGTMGAWVACTAAMLFLLIARGILTRRLDRQVLLMAALFAVCLFVPSHLKGGGFERNFAQLGTDIVRIATQAEDVDRAGSWRWIIWKKTLKTIAGAPLFGLGFEGVYVRGLQKTAGAYRAHNEFLQYTLCYGIPAGVAYFAGCLGVFIRDVRRRSSLDPVTLACLTGAFGYLVSSFFGLTLFATTPFLFLFLGMGYVRR